MNNSEPSDDSDRITVTWGMEKHSPLRFESLEYGGFFYSTKIKDGETPEQAFERAYAFLQNLARKHFSAAVDDYTQRNVYAKQQVAQAYQQQNGLPPQT